jgi:hypothetical protein
VVDYFLSHEERIGSKRKTQEVDFVLEKIHVWTKKERSKGS